MPPWRTGISVLTDARFFQGSLDDLRRVRQAVDLPLMCKDFIVDPYQIFEARDAGADVVLLIVGALDDHALKSSLQLAQRVGLDAVVEVHSAEETERALRHQVPILGVNNRDLTTFHTDIAVTERIASQVPPGVLRLSESGITSREQVRRLRPLVDGFLVGSSLMTQPDVSTAARALVYGRVKICGLTRAADARAAWDAGASFGGLILAEASPRCVTSSTAAELVGAVPLNWVGVFVEQDAEAIATQARSLGLAAVQVHSIYDAEKNRRLSDTLPAGCELWQVIHVGDKPPQLAGLIADRFVVEPRVAGKVGGSGQLFDWRLIDQVVEKDRVIVAGGLSPENITRADAIGAWGLDVNSGVEDRPGVKNEGRIAALFAKLRGGARQPPK